MNVPSSDNTPSPYHIAIIGSRKAGKTTLCASLHQSLIAQSHGFSANMISRFPDASGLNQLQALFALKFNTKNTLFRAEQSATIRKLKIGIDFTSSKWSLFDRTTNQLKGYYLVEIDDLRDDFDLLGQFAHSKDEQDALNATTNRPYTQLKDSLTNAKALIICHPAGQKLAPSEITGFIRLMSDIAIGRYGRFETIIIAFTKYERLFLNDGPRAFAKATTPSTILQIMRQTVLNDQAFATGLRALNCHQDERAQLYAVPVSAFGFLRNNGAPNFDKQTDQPLSALASIIEPVREDNPLKNALPRKKVAGFTIPVKSNPQNQSHAHPSMHWLPFLTADPFLTAMSGMPSKFMIPFGSFLSALDHNIPIEDMANTA